MSCSFGREPRSAVDPAPSDAVLPPGTRGDGDEWNHVATVKKRKLSPVLSQQPQPSRKSLLVIPICCRWGHAPSVCNALSERCARTGLTPKRSNVSSLVSDPRMSDCNTSFNYVHAGIRILWWNVSFITRAIRRRRRRRFVRIVCRWVTSLLSARGVFLRQRNEQRYDPTPGSPPTNQLKGAT